MNNNSKHVMVIAGEASGDLHAAHLVDALRNQDPSLIFSGLGGEKMRASGVHIYHDLTKFAVVGFVEVLKHYSEFKRIFNSILKEIDEVKPAAVILIDYPGFNLRLAKEIKKRGIKVIYYISPQLWAWKENRVEIIRKHVDLMLVFFQFEETFYARHGIDVTFIGHPLIDIVDVKTTRQLVHTLYGFQDYKLTIGLLPGSRAKEIQSLLPVMVSAAQDIARDFPMTQFLVMKAPTISREDITHHLSGASIPIGIVEGNTYDGINACDVCMVASGTATLETAIMLKPMVVVYKTSLLTWLMAKALIKIPNIGLVNVVAGKRIVPECVQFDATGAKIARALKEMFTNEIRLAEVKENLRRVRESLGPTGATNRAADSILLLIK
jgi:lipid-A-disaccharide synthase